MSQNTPDKCRRYAQDAARTMVQLNRECPDTRRGDDKCGRLSARWATTSRMGLRSCRNAAEWHVQYNRAYDKAAGPAPRRKRPARGWRNW